MTTLIPVEHSSNAQYADDKALALVTGNSAYLPRVQLMGATAPLVQEGKIGMGHFALFTSKVPTDIGKEFVSLLISWRAKAMQFQPEVINVFDPNSELFQQIKKRVAANPQDNVAYGPELLLWLPEHLVMATYFLGNATGRNEAPNIIGFKGGACRFTSNVIKNKKHTWFGPKAHAYQPDIVLPDFASEAYQEAVKNFNYPPASTREVAEGTERAR